LPLQSLSLKHPKFEIVQVRPKFAEDFPSHLNQK
jgi:hypothetical protein